MARALEAKNNPAIVEMTELSRAEGRAEGLVESLLAILEARGFELSEEARERILATTDQETLERWIRQAVTATSLGDVLLR